MSAVMEEEIKRWTVRRKSQLVLEIIQGKKTVSEASRQLDLPPSEIESWVDEGKHGFENALQEKPEDMREQHDRQFKDLQPVACSRRASADGLPSMRLPSCPSSIGMQAVVRVALPASAAAGGVLQAPRRI
jgi:transposase-like protein